MADWKENVRNNQKKYERYCTTLCELYNLKLCKYYKMLKIFPRAINIKNNAKFILQKWGYPVYLMYVERHFREFNNHKWRNEQ